MDWVDLNGFRAPRISASDLAYIPNQTPAVDMGDYAGASTLPAGYFAALGQDQAGRYGDWGSMSTYSDNYQIVPIDDKSFEMLVKTGDKAGTRIKYALQDGEWVPTENVGTEYWDTNHGDPQDLLKIGAALLGPYAIGSGLMAGAGGAAAGAASPGTMTTYGVLDTSLALPGTQFAPFAGAEGLLGDMSYESVFGGSTPEGTLSEMPFGGGTTPETGMLGDMSYESIFGGSVPEGTLSGEPFVSGAAGGLGGLGDIIKAIGPGDLLKAGLTLGGGLLGANAAEEQGSTGNVPAIPPKTVPKLYGGESPSRGLLSWGPMGPTETERRMRAQYMPSLLSGGRNPWGF